MQTLSVRLTDSEFCLVDTLLSMGLGVSQSDVLRNGLLRLAEPIRLNETLMRCLQTERKAHPIKKRLRRHKAG